VILTKDQDNYNRGYMSWLMSSMRQGGPVDKDFKFELGEYGSADVDVNLNGKVKVAVNLEIDIIAEVKKLAEKSATPLDDQAIAWLEKLVSIIP